MGIGASIRTIREQRGMTQADLARATAIEQSYLSRLETGSRDSRPNALVLARIAKALEISVDELFLETGIRRSKDRDAELRWKKLERVFQALPASRQVDLLALADALSKVPELPLVPKVIGDIEDTEDKEGPP